MTTKRISIVLPDLRGGGAERVCLDLAFALSSLGQNVEFALMNSGGEFLREANGKFLVFDLGAVRLRNLPISLMHYLDLRRPAAVIANMWPVTSAAVIGRALSRQRCRLLLVDHSTLSRQYTSRGRLHEFAMRTSMSLTYPKADGVAGVSDGVARDIEQLAGLAHKSVVTLHNPIPQGRSPSSLARQQAEQLWGFAEGKRILTVGSLKDEKNFPLLLHSFVKLQNRNSKLMFVGSGRNEPSLRALAAELGISHRVIFSGFQSDPSPFYATADLFVLTSDCEGFGNVIVEALSFGLPVVSTDCPSGPAEILGGGRWGTLTPVGDVQALALAIDEALATEVDRAALKLRAAAFSPETAVKGYMELLGLV